VITGAWDRMFMYFYFIHIYVCESIVASYEFVPILC